MDKQIRIFIQKLQHLDTSLSAAAAVQEAEEKKTGEQFILAQKSRKSQTADGPAMDLMVFVAQTKHYSRVKLQYYCLKLDTAVTVESKKPIALGEHIKHVLSGFITMFPEATTLSPEESRRHKVAIQVAPYAGGVVATIVADGAYQLGQSRVHMAQNALEGIEEAIADFLHGLTEPGAIRSTVYPPKVEALRKLAVSFNES